MYKLYDKSSIHVGPMELLGSFVLHLSKAFLYIIKFKINFERFIKSLIFLGYESIPMVVILTSIAAMILTVNTSIELTNHGGRELVGGLIAIANLREIVPIFIAFALSACCGTALTAEFSTMKVTEQVDALKVFKIDPIYYLITPNLLAVIVVAPLLLGIASLISILAGMLVAKVSVNLEFTEFLNSAWSALTLKELFYPLIKVEIFCVFALTLNMVMGLLCEGGAKEVGMTTTKATALVLVGIVILDGIITPLLYCG